MASAALLALYELRYVFVQPLPLADVWYVLLLPLTIGVSVVYKSIRCHSMRDVPREAASITLWILLGMGAAAVVLVALIRSLEWIANN
jgi:hypothetical protein